MNSVSVELAELVREAPLPEVWSAPQLYIETVNVAGCTLHAVGLEARRRDGQPACGSAAELYARPIRRAYYELLERAATLDVLSETADHYLVVDQAGSVIGSADGRTTFPRSPQGSVWRYARSNGIALHGTWSEACTNARLELVERDCVLRSWYGGAPPKQEPLSELRIPPELESAYEFEACSFSPGRSADCAFQPVVAGVIAFPRATDVPIAYGFSSRLTILGALRGALRECLQAVAFLWGEALPVSEPAVSSEPGFHQDYYLRPEHHDRLRAWLRGDHARRHILFQPVPRGIAGFVDLTPPTLQHRLRVAKALPSGELPLTFGPGHPLVLGEVPPELAVHPIA